MSLWKCLWQRLCRLRIARLLLQHRQLRLLQSFRLPRLHLQLCREDLHLDFQKDGIRPLDMVCLRTSLLHNPMHSLAHRSNSRWLLSSIHRLGFPARCIGNTAECTRYMEFADGCTSQCIGATTDDPTASSRNPAPAQISFRSSDFTISSPEWSQLGFS